MKTNFFLVLAIVSAGFIASCGGEQPETNEAVPMLSVDELEIPTTLAVKIEGMACPDGCAKPIASGCSKLTGIAESRVDFAEGMGYFTYDGAKLNEKDIIKCIESTNGGGIYKVTEVKLNVKKTLNGDKPTDEEAVHEVVDESKASV